MKRVLVIPADAQARLRMLDANSDAKSEDRQTSLNRSGEFGRASQGAQSQVTQDPSDRR